MLETAYYMDSLVSNLSDTLSESLHIHDAQESEGLEQNHALLIKKCLKKSATFPHPKTELSHVSSDDEGGEVDESLLEPISEDSTNKIYCRSTSLPAQTALSGPWCMHCGSPCQRLISKVTHCSTNKTDSCHRKFIDAMAEEVYSLTEYFTDQIWMYFTKKML